MNDYLKGYRAAVRAEMWEDLCVNRSHQVHDFHPHPKAEAEGARSLWDDFYEWRWRRMYNSVGRW